MTRRQQFKEMLNTNKPIDLEGFKSSPRKNVEKSCSAVTALTIIDINNKKTTVAQLKEELRLHALKRTGKKAELKERLKIHYEESHHLT